MPCAGDVEVESARTGNVRLRAGALFAAAGHLPAATAGAVASRLPQPVLTATFAAIAALAAVRMLRPSQASTGQTPVVQPRRPSAPARGRVR